MAKYVRRRAARLLNAVPASLAFALLIVQAALPWTAKHFVTQDGPSHLYTAVVVKDMLLTPHSPYAAVYTLKDKLVSNWGAAVAFNSLIPFFGVEHTEQAMASLCIILGFFSLAYFSRSLNPQVNPWSPVLNFLLCTQFLWIGFYNFYLGMALFPIVAGFYLRRESKMNLRTTGAIACGLTVLFLIHALAMAIALITMAVGWFWARVAAPMIAPREPHSARAFRAAASSLAWLLLAAAPAAVLVGRFIRATPFRGANGDLVSAWNIFPVGIFAGSGGRSGEQLLLYPAMLFYVVVGALSLRRREWSSARAGAFAAAALLFVLYLVSPDGAFGANALKMRLAWGVFILGCVAAAAVDRMQPLRVAVSLYIGCMVLGTLVNAQRNNVAPVSRAIEAYAAAMANVPAGSTVVRVRFPTERLRARLGFQDIFLDPLYHADALFAAKLKLLDLSDYQALTDSFPPHYRPHVPGAERFALWMLEGHNPDTAVMLRQALNDAPLPIEYVIVVGDHPPSDRVSDYQAAIQELDSRMRLFATDPEDAFVRVYHRERIAEEETAGHITKPAK